MRIAIDSRFYGLEHAGIGRYTINLIKQLIKLDSKNEYILLTNRTNKIEMKLPENFSTCEINITHYSFDEQLKLPFILNKIKPDLVHCPHYNVPILYQGKFIVTIFDLIKHKYPDASNTSKNYLMAKVKSMAYKFDMWWAVNQSKVIITAAQSVKRDLVHCYKTNPGKIKVIPLGIDEQISLGNVDIKEKYAIDYKYILYVGNGYEYKNVNQIVSTLKFIDPSMHLILVGSRSVFQNSLNKLIEENSVQNRVHILGYVDDQSLGTLYQKAFAFVSASKEEGFGIPPLEAMQMQCPVVLSEIAVHREICADAALYFTLDDCKDLANKIAYLNNPGVREQLIVNGGKQALKYNWQKMANETINIYQSFK